MSAEATGWVFRASPYTGAMFTLHLAIADTVNDTYGNEMWMSAPTLAAKARVSERTARYGLAQMADDGLLVLVAAKEGKARRYRFLMPNSGPVTISDVQGFCYWCQTEPSGGVDHLTPRSRGGSDDPSNLVPCCHECNSRKGSKTADEYRAWLALQSTSLTPAVAAPPATRPLQPAVETPAVDDQTPAARRDTPAVAAPNPKRTQLIPTGSKTLSVNGDQFDEFWRVYPLRKAKGAAKTAWAKALKRATPDRIIAGAIEYASDPNRDQDYTKHPATWLNGDCWDDEPAPSKPKVSKSTTNLAAWAERTGS